MPKLATKTEEILRDNLLAVQGGRTNQEMARIMCFKSEATYKKRLAYPELLTIHEIRLVCERFHIPMKEFINDYLIKREVS